MAQHVKRRRSYDSTRRREQAAATRRQVLDSAKTLFEEQGFAATSMAQIAEAAGVALKTVYLGFETKAGLLRAVWNVSLRGDDDAAPVAARAWYQEMLREPDPERKLRLNARNAVRVKRRAGTLMEVIHVAASTDPDVRALWDRIQSDFHENQGVVIRSMRRGSLKRGLSAERATDILWTLNHPSVWWLLVHERGWTPEAFERWLADAFCEQLLRG